MNLPLVSVIIPCYNYGKYLGDAIDSLIKQVYQNWECIIVDNGSTDNTAEVVKSYSDKRIKYYFQEEKGVSKARNKGLLMRKGEFIQFLDADDKLEKRKMQVQIDLLVQSPFVDIVYGDARYFLSNSPAPLLYSMDKSNAQWIKKYSLNGKDILPHLIANNIMPINSPLFRASSIKGITFNEEYKYFEDWDFFFRCSDNNLFFHYHEAPEALALIRSHSNSVSKGIYQFRAFEFSYRKFLQKKYNLPELKKVHRLGLKKTVIDLLKFTAKDFLKGRFRDGMQKLLYIIKN